MLNDNIEVFKQLESIEDDQQLLNYLERNKLEAPPFYSKLFEAAAKDGEIFTTLYNSLIRLEKFIVSMYRSYLIYCKQKGKNPVLSKALKDVKVSKFEDKIVDVASYFVGIGDVEEVTRNNYMKSSDQVILFHVRYAKRLHSVVGDRSDSLIKELESVLKLIINSEGDNLFGIFMALLKQITDGEKDLKLIMDQVKKIIDISKEIVNNCQSAGIKISCDMDGCISEYEEFREDYFVSKIKEDQNRDSDEADENSSFTAPINMLNKLLDFSGLDFEFKDKFIAALSTFSKMSDKKSADDSARKLRNTLSELFYELYKKVFLKTEKTDIDGELFDLFFNYGIVDETMFSKETFDLIRKLSHSGTVKNVHVYNTRDWLHAIYVGDKQPSKNDFDMDYNEYVIDMARKGEISAEEKQEYLENNDLKVEYEIDNFIRMNSRLTNGELSVFCPVLTQESFIGTPEQMFVKDDAITETIDWLVDVDYSVFHREQLYDSRENGIVNMVINKQVFPDVVIMPVTGANSRMWQEIDGKKRDTPGRFTFPAFTKADLKDMLAQAAGSFRWQLCKKIQGNYWNVVSEKSLTSEYYDYIQFYKKNRDLSDQVKEKINSQLQRARNNFADCFVMDYAIWVKNEVNGSMRLNKIVREIMANYCPPSKKYRENLKKQPLFAEAFARYDRERVKKVKEINNRRAAIRNANGTETPEFIEEARFREEM